MCLQNNVILTDAVLPAANELSWSDNLCTSLTGL